MAEHEAVRRDSMFIALKIRNYRLYVLGQTLSNTAAWMSRLAQDWLVLDLTGSSGIALGILTLRGDATVAVVYGFALLAGCASALENPCRQAFVQQLVGADDLHNAVALSSASFNIARLSGPALSGLLVAVFGTGFVFLIITIPFLI